MLYRSTGRRKEGYRTTFVLGTLVLRPSGVRRHYSHMILPTPFPPAASAWIARASCWMDGRYSVYRPGRARPPKDVLILSTVTHGTLPDEHTYHARRFFSHDGRNFPPAPWAISSKNPPCPAKSAGDEFFLFRAFTSRINCKSLSTLRCRFPLLITSTAVATRRSWT